MSVTFYSFVMAIFWFNFFIILGLFIQRRLSLFMGYNFSPIFLLVCLSTIRLVAPVETSYTYVIRSTTLLPQILAFLRAEVVRIAGIRLSVYEAILLVACVGSILLFLRLGLWIYREFRVVMSFEQCTDARLVRLMDDIVHTTSARCNYRIAIVDNAVDPSIWGLWSPTIILPRDILTLSDKDITSILRHEWQHHRGGDLWSKLFVHVCCCIMWWNPVIILLKNDLAQTFELKCDLRATRNYTKRERREYLQAMINLGLLSSRRAAAQRVLSVNYSGAAERKCDHLFQRFDYVLGQPSQNWKNRIMGAVVMVAALVLFVFSFSFVVQPYILPPEEDVAMATMYVLPDDTVRLHNITPENAYLIENSDKTYSLFIDNEYFRTLNEEELESSETYRLLPIIYE